jgi:hypothetical protein
MWRVAALTFLSGIVVALQMRETLRRGTAIAHEPDEVRDDLLST